MNIFVLSTGRCGSTTFIKACRHISNFSCAHESRSGMLGDDRMDYPDNHIEADNRLSWVLGRLDERYEDDAIYVHLKRNERDTARSFTNRYWSGIIRAYRGRGILMGVPEDSDPIDVATDYCHTVNSNIELFLKDKSKTMEVHLENIEQNFAVFWDFIDAKGDIDEALKEFQTPYNASKRPRVRASAPRVVRPIPNKLRRLVATLPSYVKNV